MVPVRSSPVVVGRGRELAELYDAVDRACSGRPSLVLLVGEAGIGKTRLLRETADEARRRGMTVLIGSDAPFAYGPIVGVLRDLRRELGDSALRRLVTGVRSPLATLVPGLEPAEVSGKVPAEGPLFEAMLDLLVTLGRQQPVLVGVDNLHTADRSTLQLVRFLAANLAEDRVLLVATSRLLDELEEPVGSHLAELARLPGAAKVAPKRLTPAEVSRQVEAILEGRPSEHLVEQVARRSQGIPFYVEELVASRVESEQLPVALEQILAARLDGLSAAGRQVLQSAAALGSRPHDRLIRASVELSEEQLTDALQQLIDGGLLIPERDLSGRYRFRHDLIREVVVGRMPVERRRRLHRSAAQRLQMSPELAVGGAERVHGELAGHWRQAGEPDLAFTASIAASEEAIASHGLSEAVAHLERALELWDQTSRAVRGSVGERYELHHRCAELAQPLADPVLGLTHADCALAEPDIPAARRAAVHVLRSYSLFYLGRRGEADDALRRAQKILPEEPSTWRARVLIATAGHHSHRGRQQEALKYSSEAIDVAERIGDRIRLVRASLFHGDALQALGRERDGIQWLSGALTTALEIDDPECVWGAYNSLVNGLIDAGRFEEAIEIGTRGLRWADKHGIGASDVEWLSMGTTEALFLAGRWQEADRLLARMRTVARKLMIVDVIEATTKAPLRIGQGRLDEARELLAGVADQLDQAAHPQSAWHLLALNAELALHDDRYEDARSIAQRACDAGQQIMIAERRTTSDAAWFFEPTLSHAIRAEANHADEARGRGDEDTLADVHEHASRYIDVLRRAAADAPPDTYTHSRLVAAVALGHAELTRLEGHPDPHAWEAAVAAPNGIPHCQAYAKFRFGQALLARDRREDASRTLNDAWRIATDLGAQPLQQHIETLARHARIRVTDQGLDTTSIYDLTPRENDVLELIADGHTNQQIADTLYITLKTVESHVTNILRKLDVRNRTEAAAALHRSPSP